MKCAFELDLGSMIYIPNIKRSKVDRGDTKTHRQQDDLTSLLLFIYFFKYGRYLLMEERPS
jgi:hypothetical protein